jgi:glyoxylate utilization-related uncharacterized protein
MLSGEMEVVVGDQTFHLLPFHFHFLAENTSYSINNKSRQEPAVFLYCSHQVSTNVSDSTM